MTLIEWMPMILSLGAGMGIWFFVKILESKGKKNRLSRKANQSSTSTD
jgi:hypothetical protein